MLCVVNMDRFEVTKFEIKEFSVIAQVIDKKHLILVTVYGPAQEEQKEQFLTELSPLCSERNKAIIIGRDFNILRFSS